MDIRIGNDIQMNIRLKGSDIFTSKNIVKIETRLLLPQQSSHCHRFPKFYDPTPYTTHSSGVPVYHVHPHYEVGAYCHFHPEFTEPHWWPNYCGFGVCSKQFCCGCKCCDKKDNSILLHTEITNVNNIVKAVFEAYNQKLLGEYRLVVRYTVYEPGYGPDNLHTYTADYGVVFKLTQDEGMQGDIILNIPYAQKCVVTVQSNDINKGTVTPVGTVVYDFGTELEIEATPVSDEYVFERWNDGNTDSKRTITITEDATYIAIFKTIVPVMYTVTAEADDPTHGSVTGGGTFREGTVVTLTATASSGWAFKKWSNGSTANPLTFTLDSDVELTAIFEEHTVINYVYYVKNKIVSRSTLENISKSNMASLLQQVAQESTSVSLPENGKIFSIDVPDAISVTAILVPSLYKVQKHSGWDELGYVDFDYDSLGKPLNGESEYNVTLPDGITYSIYGEASEYLDEMKIRITRK